MELQAYALRCTWQSEAVYTERCRVPPAAVPRVTAHFAILTLGEHNFNLLLVLVVLSVALLGLYAVIEPYRLRLARRVVPVPGLPGAFDGLRLLHLSDIHLGSWHGGGRHAGVAAVSCSYDAIFVTGDLIERNSHIYECAELLGAMAARAPVYVVLGNHDFGPSRKPNDPDALAEALRSRGVHVLRNQAVAMERHGERLWIAGVDDPYKHRDDVAAALKDVPPHSSVLLLAHSADVLPRVPPERVGLVLAGHSHGGQVRLPLLGAIVSRTRTRLPDYRHLVRYGTMLVHLSPGLGSPIPVRFLCPPEASVVELRCGSWEPGGASSSSVEPGGGG